MCRLTARQAEVPSEREGVEPRCRCDQVGGPEPGVETQASVVKDRPSGDRGLAPTSPAHKAQASALPGCPAATDRTSEPVGPTTLDQVAPTSRVIGKRRLELRQGRRERSAHSSNYEGVELSGQAAQSPLPACLWSRCRARLKDATVGALCWGAHRGHPVHGQGYHGREVPQPPGRSSVRPPRVGLSIWAMGLVSVLRPICALHAGEPVTAGG